MEEKKPTPKSGMIAVKNQGKGALSVDLITRTQLLNDTLPAISDNLRTVSYTHLDVYKRQILTYHDDCGPIFMHTHSKRHHSFCRLCTVCKCVYGRSHLTKFDHTYRTDPRPTHGGDVYKRQHMGKFMDEIKKGTDANEALKKVTGTYGRVTAEQGAVKSIDPRHE